MLCGRDNNIIVNATQRVMFVLKKSKKMADNYFVFLHQGKP